MKRIHQKLTSEQKIQMLTTDFLDRDQTTFVKIRRTGRLGWESAIPTGTPYSDYMLSPASDEEMKEPLKPNGFGTTWLGNLVEDLGVDFNTVQCRGSWDDPTLENSVLRFSTETAWYRCTEVDDLIREKYPSIEIFFICEEPGMCIYEKNSDVYFDEEYILDYYAGDTYYLSEAEMLSELSDEFGVDFADINEALILVEEHNNKDENDDDQIYVHKFELVD